MQRGVKIVLCLFLSSVVSLADDHYSFTETKIFCLNNGSVLIKWNSNIPKDKDFLENVWVSVERSRGDIAYQNIFYKNKYGELQYTDQNPWPGYSNYRVRLIIKKKDRIEVLISKSMGVIVTPQSGEPLVAGKGKK